MIVPHSENLVSPHELWSAWTGEPIAAVAVALAGLAYGAGLRHLWSQGGPGRGVPYWRAGCFAGGLLVLGIALFSPVDRLGKTLFAAHMIQHLLLMLMAPLLLVLGAPPLVLLWSLPPGTRRLLAGWWNRRQVLPRVAGALVNPAVAWLLSLVVLLLWHVPGCYQAALANEAIHAIEHLTFLVTGFLFWWVVLRPDGHRRLNHVVSVIYVFSAALPSGLLGALLTFAGRPLYRSQSAAASLWGLTSLEDQQLAGLIMWMPGGLIYFAVAAALFLIWLRKGEIRTGTGRVRAVWT